MLLKSYGLLAVIVLSLSVGLRAASSAPPRPARCPTLEEAVNLPEKPGGGVLRGDVDGDGRADHATIRFALRARASCGFFLVVETSKQALSVRIPEWYKPPQDLLVSEWWPAEPFVALIVRLDTRLAQVVVARSHSASFANVSLYGIVRGKLKLLPLRGSGATPNELSLFGGVMSSTQVRCRRGGPLIELTWGGAYKRFRRTDYRLADGAFVIASRRATVKPTLNGDVEPFTGCAVTRGRRL
jgi:hypothetical protein